MGDKERGVITWCSGIRVTAKDAGTKMALSGGSWNQERGRHKAALGTERGEKYLGFSLPSFLTLQSLDGASPLQELVFRSPHLCHFKYSRNDWKLIQGPTGPGLAQITIF